MRPLDVRSMCLLRVLEHAGPVVDFLFGVLCVRSAGSRGAGIFLVEAAFRGSCSMLAMSPKPFVADEK